MATRKIIKSGNTSYVVSLPIDWIRRNNLQARKLVHIKENELGELILATLVKPESLKGDIITIKVDGKEEELIYLEFLTAYIRDASSVVFEGKEIPAKGQFILESVKQFIGLDVIEQSTINITVKNFYSVDQEMSPKLLLKKMNMVNLVAFKLLDVFFTQGFDNEDFVEIQKLYEQNERLFLLIRKSLLKLLEHPKLMSILKTNHLQVSKERIYAQSLIHISEHILVLGKVFLFLDSKAPEAKDIHTHYEDVTKTYQQIFNAINNQTPNVIYDFLKKFPKERSGLNKFLKSLEDPLAVQITTSLLSIYYNLKDMGLEALA